MDTKQIKMIEWLSDLQQFAKDETTPVNAKTLYPYEVVSKAINLGGRYYRSSMPAMDDTNRLMINKYWDNLADYFNGASFNGIAVTFVNPAPL